MTVTRSGPNAAAPSPTGEGAARLEARGVHVRFAGVHALDDVHLAVEQGEIVGLIGPNGAGKTTLVNALSGFQRPTTGHVLLDGADITRWAAHRRARAGVARTFQSVRAFRGLTVRENVEAAARSAGAAGRGAAALTGEVLDLVGLGPSAGSVASALSYGQERRLGIARALAGRPRILLLDEPAAGLNEQESDELLEILRGIRADHGCGLLVIEHDMRLIMRLCDRLHVLDYGRTLAAGLPAEVARDARVREAYLGSSVTRVGAAGAGEEGSRAAG
ncbi:ABC transporter ATP-binding protein [Geodermatophilus ruber]|uniref:ABC transporter ATP-binding protein n=1 Tax=Geodermatophilus ruber TaxID=504800 RepID=UPI001C434BD6|nr:ABC transporter ATP-binding protein [Geodermatophilus ruber]